jgi:hypothetical protein
MEMRMVRPRQASTAIAFVLALLLAVAAGTSRAQEFAFAWNPRTGDAWIDATLQDINRYGQRYPDAFIDELARYYGAPRELAGELLEQRRWAPGDVYFACALAQIAGQPCRAVLDAWEEEHAQGWAAVEQRFGVEPASNALARLRRGIAASYARWARPLPADPARAPATRQHIHRPAR